MQNETKVVVPHGRPDRIVRVIGPIGPASVLPAIEALLRYGAEGDDPIMLHLATPGGCVISGLSLVDVMNHVRAPVFTIASGVVASMGAVLLVCGQPGYRYALPRARVMLHPTSGSSSGRLEELESAMEFQRELDREVHALLLEKTKIPRTQLRGLLRKERFLSATQALEFGLIDHIL